MNKNRYKPDKNETQESMNKRLRDIQAFVTVTIKEIIDKQKLKKQMETERNK